MGHELKTQSAIRAAFWQGNAHLRSAYRAKKRQNDYSTTIRCEFVEFVDMLARNGHISEALARCATL